MNCPSLTDWIGAIANGVTALAVGIGVYIGYQQLEAWRAEAKLKRKAEVAEWVISLANRISDAFNDVRSPMESVPADSENHRETVINKKWNRLKEHDKLFEDMRSAQIQARAIVDITVVNESIAELIGIRREIYAAHSTLSGVPEEHYNSGRHRDLYNDLEMIMYKTFGDRDRISPRQDADVSSIKNAHFPVVRLEIDKK